MCTRTVSTLARALEAQPAVLVAQILELAAQLDRVDIRAARAPVELGAGDVLRLLGRDGGRRGGGSHKQ